MSNPHSLDYVEAQANFQRVRSTLIRVIRDPESNDPEIDFWLGEFRRAQQAAQAAFRAAVRPE